ncbi:MAG: biopolymer transporter ExbD [Sulfurimicrobium sp.]|nr:biopolymer transporter ExbD [Sulfurimicrobium sp.]
MRQWHDERRPRARIEIIPMIDVMMFLLVFFVLISLNVIPALGLKTKLPHSSQSERHVEPRNAIVTLGKTGELQLDGTEISLDILPARLLALRQLHPQLAVIINGDQATELQRLVDVMDKVKSAGFHAISIATMKRAGE